MDLTLRRRVINEKKTLIYPERNLSKWPQIFTTHKCFANSREIWRTLEDGTKIGIIVGRQMTKGGEEIEVGTLTVPELVLFMGLHTLWEAQGKRSDGQINGEYRSFLEEILERQASGKAYEIFENSLKRLAAIPITWKSSFYDAETHSYITLEDYHFHLIRDLHLARRSRGNRLEVAVFSCRFDDRVLKNLLRNFTKPLNFKQLLGFKRELTVLMYCFLDVVMANKENWQRKTSEFIHDDLQLGSNRYSRPANRKADMLAALKELEGCELSSGKLVAALLRKTRDGADWKMVIRKQPRAAERQEQQAIAQIAAAEREEMYTRMVEVLGGVERNRSFYRHIARVCPRDLIHTALQDTLAEAREGKIKSSKAAFFGYWIQQLAARRGISLGLKSSFTDILRNS